MSGIKHSKSARPITGGYPTPNAMHAQYQSRSGISVPDKYDEYADLRQRPTDQYVLRDTPYSNEELFGMAQAGDVRASTSARSAFTNAVSGAKERRRKKRQEPADYVPEGVHKSGGIISHGVDVQGMLKEQFSKHAGTDASTLYHTMHNDKSIVDHIDELLILDSTYGTNESPGVWLFQSESSALRFLGLDKLADIVAIDVFEMSFPKFSTTVGMKEVTMQIMSIPNGIRGPNDSIVHFSFKLENDTDRYLLVPRRSRYKFNRPISFEPSLRLAFRDPLNLITFPPQTYTGSITLTTPPVFTVTGGHTLTGTDIVSIEGLNNIGKSLALLTNTMNDIESVGPVSLDVNAIHHLPVTISSTSMIHLYTTGNDVSFIPATYTGAAPAETLAPGVITPFTPTAGAQAIRLRAANGGDHVLVATAYATNNSIYLHAINNSTYIVGAEEADNFGVIGNLVDIDVKYLTSISNNDYYVVSAMSDTTLVSGVYQVDAGGTITVNPLPTDVYTLHSGKTGNFALNTAIVGNRLITLVARQDTPNNVNIYAQSSRINFPLDTGISIDEIVVFPATEYNIDAHDWAIDSTTSVEITSAVVSTQRLVIGFTTGYVAVQALLDVNQTTGIITTYVNNTQAVVNFLRNAAIAAGVATGASTLVATSNTNIIIGFINQGISPADILTEMNNLGVSNTLSSSIRNTLMGATTSVSMVSIGNDRLIMYMNHTPVAATITSYVQSLLINQTLNTISEIGSVELTSANADNQVRVVKGVNDSRLIFSTLQDAAAPTKAQYTIGVIQTNEFTVSAEDEAGLAITVPDNSTFTISELTFTASNSPGPSLLLADTLSNLTVNVLTRRFRIMMRVVMLNRGFSTGMYEVST